MMKSQYHRWRYLLLALAWLLPSGASAEDRAEAALRQGRALYKQGRCSGALPLFHTARRLAESSRQRGRSYIYIGLCQLVKKNRKAARKAFAEALTQLPALATFSQQFGAEAHQLIQKLAARSPGMLSVLADRKDAVVLVDGKQVGPAPYLGQVAAGKHTVAVQTQDGVWRHTRQVTLERGGYLSINAKLKQTRSHLTVRSTPTGARVYLDGEIIGNTPLQRAVVKPGRHAVTVRRAGYGEQTRRLLIPGGRPTTLTVILQPDPVVVTARRVTDQKRPGRRRFWTWVAAGGAAAAAITGVALGISVRRDADEYADIPYHEAARLDSLERSMQAKVTGVNVSLGVAGALAVTSAVLFFWEGGYFDSRERQVARPGRTRLAPMVGRSQGLVLTTEF